MDQHVISNTLSSSTEEDCKTRSYLFPIGRIIYAFLNGGFLLEYEQHTRAKTFLHVVTVTLTTKSLTVQLAVCVYFRISLSWDDVNFKTSPGKMHILSFISRKLKYYTIFTSLV